MLNALSGASPSSRRAWIEISNCCSNASIWRVALLAEGVDRNLRATKKKTRPSRSPSSRRAWIEIPIAISRFRNASVALLAEGVDRN